MTWHIMTKIQKMKILDAFEAKKIAENLHKLGGHNFAPKYYILDLQT